MMTAHPSESELGAFLGGETPEDQGGEIALHLDQCEVCRETAERLTEVSRELWASLLVAADRSETPSFVSAPEIPGHSVLRELGRGGCGIVYLAKENSTGREVAVKVLRTGPWATPSEHAWFRAEAISAANLSHPNIVTVHGVGDHRSIPYYSMEYHPAGSLAGRLDGKPCDPKQSAALIERIAGAVEYAHRRNLIHRDLKPGNILLGGEDFESGFGVPKISDFGMAKQNFLPAMRTPTQAVFGTPSYMAPEQAFGRSREVGPAADVYALGVILYELLTGRPPFQGGTQYETLMQVRDQEPVPPRRLRPGIPRDLETVCLKCLEKAPERRYRTAEALSLDLRAFLDGKPVASRPVGRWERIVRWAVRNPPLAIVSSLAIVLPASFMIFLTVSWREAERVNRNSMETLKLFSDLFSKLYHQTGLLSRDDRGALLKALEQLDKVSAGMSLTADEQDGVAYSRLQLATQLHSLGETDNALRVTRGGVSMLEELVKKHPESGKYRYHLAEGLSQLGGMYEATGANDEGFVHRVRAMEIAEKLTRQFPDNLAHLANLGSFQSHVGRLHAEKGRFDKAEKMLVAALASHRVLIKNYPDSHFHYGGFGYASRLLLDVAARSHENAERYWDLIRESMTMIDQARPKPSWARIVGALSIPGAVSLLDRMGRRTEADLVLVHGLNVWSDLASRVDAGPDAGVQLAHWLDLAGHRAWTTDTKRAHDWFQREQAVLNKLAAGPNGSRGEFALAEFHALCPDPTLRDGAKALDHAKRYPSEEPYARYLIGVCRHALGEDQGALAELEQMRADGRIPKTDGCRLVGLACLAASAARLGDEASARDCLEELRRELAANPLIGGPRLVEAVKRAELLLGR